MKDVRVVISCDDDNFDFPYKFSVLPRVGERVTLQWSDDLYVGEVEMIEHQSLNEDEAAQPIVFVNSD